METIFKSRVSKFIFLVFIIFNIFLFLNLGLYNDDWLFYNISDQTFYEWSLRVWNGEGGIIRRHIVVPYYIILHLIPPFFVYCISLILSLIIFIIFFDIIFKLVKKNILDTHQHKVSTNLILIIFLIWYFFPFNIGGQFWITAIIHTKISAIFLLLSIKFLIKKKLFLSFLSLSLSFNSYEIFFFSYLPLSLVFYYGGLVKKKDFQIYFIGSSLIQLFFLFNKVRPDNSIDQIDYLNVISESFINIGKLFWSMYSSFPVELNIIFKIILLIIILLPIFYYTFNSLKIYRKSFIYPFFILIILSVYLNSLVTTLGSYGYWGKGIFSRTMFMPSIVILFFLAMVIVLNSKKTKFYIICLFLVIFSFFIKEINNWKNSKNIQNQIIENLNIFDDYQKQKNLILFKGPCYYNGVDIFNATWDLNSAVEINFPNLASNNFIPTQNWKIKFDNKNNLTVHIFNFNLNDYKNLILWDYKNSRVEILNFKKGLDLDKLSSNDCHIGSNESIRAKKFLYNLKNKL